MTCSPRTSYGGRYPRSRGFIQTPNSGPGILTGHPQKDGVDLERVDLLPEDSSTSKEEDPRFTELLAEFTRKRLSGQFEAGAVLLQMVEEGIFGPWGCFRDLMKGGLRSNEQRGHQLINAYKNFVLLRENGCPLPINENQIRPLTLLKKEELKVKAWQRAVAQKQSGQPSGEDVQREVNRLTDPKFSKASDDASRQYRKCFQVIRSQLLKADRIRADGDLEEFLLCDDKRSQRRKQAIAKLMVSDGVKLGDHFKKFEEFLEELPEDEFDESICTKDRQPE